MISTRRFGTARRSVVLVTFSAFGALMLACGLDPTDGMGASRGPSGSLGTECDCANGQPQCDSTQSGCQQGLVCARGSVAGQRVCTRSCPCPLDFACRAEIGGGLCFPR